MRKLSIGLISSIKAEMTCSLYRRAGYRLFTFNFLNEPERMRDVINETRWGLKIPRLSNQYHPIHDESRPCGALISSGESRRRHCWQWRASCWRSTTFSSTQQRLLMRSSMATHRAWPPESPTMKVLHSPPQSPPIPPEKPSKFTHLILPCSCAHLLEPIGSDRPAVPNAGSLSPRPAASTPSSSLMR